MKYFTALLLFFISVFSYSQKYDLGKVSIKELEEKRHPEDSAAAAAVLYNKVRTTFVFSDKNGFSVVHDFEIRIKIYKKEGLQYATYEVPYYVGYENLKQEILKVSDAATYNLVNGKIEKTKLSGEGTFKEKVNKNWKTITITMPNVKEGSIVEFRYELKSENIVSFPTVNFQKDIPVNYAEYKTEIPVYYVYKPIVSGYIDVKTEAKQETGYKNYTDAYGHNQAIDFQQIAISHIAKNIPALKEEEYVDNLDNYRCRITYELETIRNPGVPEKNLAKTWEGVAKSIFDDDDFGKQITAREYFENDLRPLVAALGTKQEKANAIFDYVRTKMNWNKEFGIFADKGVKKAYLDRTGNAAEINFILIAMLNSAGILSSPVLISTIKNGISVYPSRTAFNYVVAAYESDGKYILLDATNKYLTPGILPRFALNWDGRLINRDGTSEEISLTPPVQSKNNINIMAVIDKTGKISGKARVVKTDYEALSFREKYSGVNTDNYLEKLENLYNGTQIKNYVLENETNLSKPIQETFEFESDNLSEVIGDKIYISPLLFFTGSKNPFSQETRKLPVYFGYPELHKYTISLDIPEGYAVESVPAPLAISTGENVATFKYNILADGNKIQVIVSSDINMMVVSSDFYPVLKDYYKKLVDKQNEKIVLKKV